MRPHESSAARDSSGSASDRTAARPARAKSSGADGAGRPTQSLLELQSAAGNAAVVQLLRQQDQHQHGDGCGHQQSEQPAAQRSAVHDVLRSGGQPLDGATRTEMESRLGADFSSVRIHNDSAAKASAAEVGAHAYTSGDHVVLGSGGADKHTLAHELTHVIQQRQGPVAGTDNGSGLRVSDPSDRFEREAEANATRAMSGSPVQRAASHDGGGHEHGEAAAPAVQRAKDNGEGSSGGKQNKGKKKDDTPAPSLQGEHVFNALDDAAKAFADLLEALRSARVIEVNAQAQAKNLSKAQRGRAASLATVKTTIANLKTSANAAGTQRDHPRFRSASHGAAKTADGDQNSRSYGDFKAQVLASVDGCGTRNWRGGAQLATLETNLLPTITDPDAARILRNEDLIGGQPGSSDKKTTQGNAPIQVEFDTWLRTTSQTMADLFRDMRTAAQETHRMLRETRRGAWGYGDADADLSGTDADPDPSDTE